MRETLALYDMFMDVGRQFKSQTFQAVGGGSEVSQYSGQSRYGYMEFRNSGSVEVSASMTIW